MRRYVVEFRKLKIENTDPQRRCYNGCNFSERVYWSEWDDLLSYDTIEDAEESADVFSKNNKSTEYRVRDTMASVSQA